MAMAPLVSIVDDDESVRESLPDLLREFGFRVAVFAGAAEFLASTSLDETDCLVLDIGMPGMSGPELQRELKIRGKQFPIIFITARVDEVARLRLLEQGATACLLKPFSEAVLRNALDMAFKINRGLG